MGFESRLSEALNNYEKKALFEEIELLFIENKIVQQAVQAFEGALREGDYAAMANLVARIAQTSGQGLNRNTIDRVVQAMGQFLDPVTAGKVDQKKLNAHLRDSMKSSYAGQGEKREREQKVKPLSAKEKIALRRRGGRLPAMTSRRG